MAFQEFRIAGKRAFADRRQKKIDRNRQRYRVAEILGCTHHALGPFDQRRRIFSSMREPIEHKKSADDQSRIFAQKPSEAPTLSLDGTRYLIESTPFSEADHSNREEQQQGRVSISARGI